MINQLLLGLNGLAVLATLGFFLVSVADHRVGEHNIVLWLTLFGVIGSLFGFGITKHRAKKPQAAKTLLLILPIPTIGTALFIAVAIFLETSGN